MPGPTQDDRKKDQGQGPSTGTMGGDAPPPPPDLSKESFGEGPQKVRDDYKKEQTKDQQAMSAEMSKGRGQSDQGQAQQQNQDNTQRR